MLDDDDRFGIAWRREIAATIRDNLHHFDLLQLIADDWLAASERSLSGLRVIGARIPLHLHGIGLGAASASPVDRQHLDPLARLIRAVRPDRWSEHLAFVRAGGIEIGHLAAPPRTTDTVAGTIANLEQVASAVGSLPELENVATLLVPPTSDWDEATWVRRITDGSGARLLLDLHNLHANARSGGIDASSFLDTLSLDRIGTIHIAGGCELRGSDGSERILDDHLHAVPDDVFRLLTEIGARTPQALDVILERDGRFPPMADVVDELERARAALAAGRARRRS